MKRITLLLSIVLLNVSVQAQTGFSWDRVVLGGNFGAGFSSRESSVAVSPTIGYRINERLTAGVGAIYQYYQYKDPAQKIDFNFNNYGGKVFGNYMLPPFLIAHSEYELLDLEYIYINPVNATLDSRRRTVGSWFVGGGYRQMFGSNSNSSFDIMVLFNLTETAYTPYSNPIIRFGIGLGL